MAKLIFEETFKVTERENRKDTNQVIQNGDRLVFTAWGTIWAGVWFTGENSPDGWNNTDGDSKFPHPGSNPYCLYGLIEGDNTFKIGRSFDRVYNGPGGKVFLGINDDKAGNGSGAFYCHMQIWR